MKQWHELWVEGDAHAVRAFAVGFAAGRSAPADVLFGADLELEAESFGERLRDLFLAGSHHVVLAPAALATPLCAAIDAHGDAVRLRVERRRTIESASFRFEIETASREIATRLRAMLVDRVPSGVRVDGLSEKEEKHPEARGPEPFAPLHAFTYRATGNIVGRFPEVVALWKKSRPEECVEIGRIALAGKNVT
jgi:hypothetical protein